MLRGKIAEDLECKVPIRGFVLKTPFNATGMKKISTVMNLAQAVHLLNNMEEGKNSSFPEAVSLSYILNISACHKENCLTDSLRPCRTVHCEQILQKRGIFDCFI